MRSFALGEARPKALPLETATFEKVDETFDFGEGLSHFP